MTSLIRLATLAALLLLTSSVSYGQIVPIGGGGPPVQELDDITFTLVQNGMPQSGDMKVTVTFTAVADNNQLYFYLYKKVNGEYVSAGRSYELETLFPAQTMTITQDYLGYTTGTIYQVRGGIKRNGYFVVYKASADVVAP